MVGVCNAPELSTTPRLQATWAMPLSLATSTPRAIPSRNFTLATCACDMTWGGSQPNVPWVSWCTGITEYIPAQKWVFPKIRGTFLGAPIMRIIIFWGLYWGPLILGNYQVPQHDFTKLPPSHCPRSLCPRRSGRTTAPGRLAGNLRFAGLGPRMVHPKT